MRTAALGSRLRPCQLRAWTEADDRADKPELLQFALSIPVDMLAGERVYSVTALALFDTRLERRARVQFEALAAVTQTSGVPGRALWVDGALQRAQRWPLRVRGGTEQLHLDVPRIVEVLLYTL